MIISRLYRTYLLNTCSLETCRIFNLLLPEKQQVDQKDLPSLRSPFFSRRPPSMCLFRTSPKIISTQRLKPSISSSTDPPAPAAAAKLIELPTYTGSCIFLASTRASRVVKSIEPSWIYRAVESAVVGLYFLMGRCGISVGLGQEIAVQLAQTRETDDDLIGA